MAASSNTGDGFLSIDTDVQLATPWDAETLRGARDPARCRRARGRRDARFRAGTSSRGVETAANIRDAVRGSDGMCAGCRLGCRFVSLVRFWLPNEGCRAFRMPQILSAKSLPRRNQKRNGTRCSSQ